MAINDMTSELKTGGNLEPAATGVSEPTATNEDDEFFVAVLQRADAHEVARVDRLRRQAAAREEAVKRKSARTARDRYVHNCGEMTTHAASTLRISDRDYCRMARRLGHVPVRRSGDRCSRWYWSPEAIWAVAREHERLLAARAAQKAELRRRSLHRRFVDVNRRVTAMYALEIMRKKIVDVQGVVPVDDDRIVALWECARAPTLWARLLDDPFVPGRRRASLVAASEQPSNAPELLLDDEPY
jgi:hypothetical protein